jgi:hypothetical protein
VGTTFKRTVVCIAAAAIFGVAGAGGAATGYQWLTLSQARRAVANHNIPLIWCHDVTGFAPGAYPCEDYDSVRLHVLSGTIAPMRPSRVIRGQRRWQKFLVHVTCGSDSISGRSFHGTFYWRWQTRGFPESELPANPDYTGYVKPGC